MELPSLSDRVVNVYTIRYLPMMVVRIMRPRMRELKMMMTRSRSEVDSLSLIWPSPVSEMLEVERFISCRNSRTVEKV